MGQLHDLSAVEQANAVRAGRVSPVELVEHYLARIDAWSETVGAFVTVTPDAARAQARAAELLRGRTPDVRTLPPLFGVPTAVKDLNAVAGVPMKLGSAAFANLVPDYDDDVVALLRSAGTISLGKTNTPEFGLPCYTEPDPSVAPPARTPFDLTRSAGGSSGGAGAAVASGLIPIAQGSDGGGSIRIPASACGLVGIKPARGRISNGPHSEVSGLGVNGPLARTVADAATLLDAMALPQPGDPNWAPPLPAGETFAGQVGRDPGRLRIGRAIANILDAPVDPACVVAYEAASALLAGLGHEVVDIEAPPFGPVYEHFITVWCVGAASAPLSAEQEALLRPLTRYLRERGAHVSGTQFATAMSVLQVTARRHLAATWRYDAVLTPTLAQLPGLIGTLRDDADPAKDFAEQCTFTPYTAVYNMTGQPAISLPLHVTETGLPVGVQLVGRSADEATLIRLAAQLEAAAPWADRKPAIW